MLSAAADASSGGTIGGTPPDVSGTSPARWGSVVIGVFAGPEKEARPAAGEIAGAILIGFDGAFDVAGPPSVTGGGTTTGAAASKLTYTGAAGFFASAAPPLEYQ